MAGKNGSALERARQLFAGPGPFGSDVPPIALAAGCSEGFNPSTSPVDQKINRFLGGCYGQNWREKAAGPKPWRPDNAAAQELPAAAAEAEALRLRWQAIVDERFTAQEQIDRAATASGVTGDGRPNEAARQVDRLMKRLVELERQQGEVAILVTRAKHRIHELTTKAYAFERRDEG